MATGSFDAAFFAASPLYAALCPVVAAEPELLDIARQGRPGQRPEYLFFGAVHRLLLAGTDRELAAFYPSVLPAHPGSPDLAGPAFVDFCRRFRADLLDLVRTKLVQTNHVRRAVGLRAALAAIAPDVGGPVELIEVGSSAGLLLNQHRYGYRLRRRDGTTADYGEPASPVQLVSECRGDAIPDLDSCPEIAAATGVDLEPVDVGDPEERAWLEALVWPEDDEQRRLLVAACDLAVAHPVRVLAGDAAEVLPALAGHLPAGRDRVVFHSACRIHVPDDRLAAFDAAVSAVGRDGPLWHIAVEYPATPGRDGIAVDVTAPDGVRRTVAVVDGHLRWLELRTRR